jgi:hypothetical protein
LSRNHSQIRRKAREDAKAEIEAKKQAIRDKVEKMKQIRVELLQLRVLKTPEDVARKHELEHQLIELEGQAA